MYAFLQIANCDDYDKMPKIQDYKRRTPPRANRDVEKIQLFAFNAAIRLISYTTTC